MASHILVAFASIASNTGSKLARRARDHLQHLGCRRLLLQYSVRSSVRWRSSLSRRAFSIAMTAWLAKFCDQLDLLVGERPDLLAIDADRADQLALLEHRHDEKRCERRRGRRERRRWIAFDVGLLRRQIVDVDDLLRPDDVTKCGCPEAGGHRLALPHLGQCRRRVVHRDNAECAPPRTSTSLPNLASQMRVAFARWPGTPAPARQANLTDDAAAPRRSPSAAPAPHSIRGCGGRVALADRRPPGARGDVQAPASGAA